MNLTEEERRARLLKSRAERLPDIKKQFEEAQKRNFNSNFAPGGKDAKLVGGKAHGGKKGSKAVKNASKGKKGSTKASKVSKGTPKSQAKIEANRGR